MIPSTNKTTRLTRKTTTIKSQLNQKTINNILTKQFINVNFKTAIFKTDISDHFPVCVII